MTSPNIQAVLFDMGGTLEQVYYDDELRLQATYGFKELLAKHDLDPGCSAPELYAAIKAGMKKYHAWRLETERELAPERSWSEFILVGPNWPRERVAVVGEELAFYWDTQFSRRALRPEAPAVLKALRDRGLPLGLISNIMSRDMVPHYLDRYGIAEYFSVALASAVVGWRKPNPCIFLEAARRIGVPPSACAYVGDTVSRDVVGAHRAGFGMAIQIKSFLTTVSDNADDLEPPDATIENLMRVVELIRPFES